MKIPSSKKVLACRLRDEAIMNLFHLGKGKITTLHELFLDQLRDLYSAETQLTKALPEMVETANEAKMKQAAAQALNAQVSAGTSNGRACFQSCAGKLSPR